MDGSLACNNNITIEPMQSVFFILIISEIFFEKKNTKNRQRNCEILNSYLHLWVITTLEFTERNHAITKSLAPFLFITYNPRIPFWHHFSQRKDVCCREKYFFLSEFLEASFQK